MMHVSDGALQSFLDDELTLPERRRVEGHVAECESCAQELALLRQASSDLSAAFRLLDSAAPPPARPLPPAVRELARPARQAVNDTRGAVVRIDWRKAAVIVLAAAGVLSGVVPGSPVYGWPAAIWQRITASAPAAVETPPPAPAAPRAENEYAAILPSGGRVDIVLDARTASAPIRVRLVDTDRASVDVVGAPPENRFRAGDGRLELIGSGAELTIELPRAVLEARLEVGGRLYLRLVDGQIETLVPARYSSGGAEVFFDPVR